MRQVAIVLWLLVPVIVGAYHYGPGQDRWNKDKTQHLLDEAKASAAAGEWSEAVIKFDDAIAAVPANRPLDVQRIRLERCKAQMNARQLAEAHADLATLVSDLEADKNADPGLLREARHAQADSQYYMTWLMRLEGQPNEIWEPEIEGARQTFRLLAEEAGSQKDSVETTARAEDLEATIRLARMELSDLQGMPLPSQCQGCCSKCNGKKPGKKQGKKPGEKKPEDSRGAGSGPPPGNAGS